MNEFRAILKGLLSGAGPTTEELQRVMLAEFSETEDNLGAARRLGVGDSGLTVNSGQTPVADILNALEGLPVPDQVVEALGSLSQSDFDAALRITSLVLVALEGGRDEASGD